MAVKTRNIYGKISISEKTVEKFVARVATDCYGIVEFVPFNFFNAVAYFMGFGSKVKGVKVRTSGNRIYISVACVVKYGVSVKAVIEALNESIKYKVEHFTGMICDVIDVKVISIKK